MDDSDIFGKGIYFSHSPRFAATRLAGREQNDLILSWVAVRSPYPLLETESINNNPRYDAQFIIDSSSPSNMILSSELIVSDPLQCQPAYWIHLEKNGEPSSQPSSGASPVRPMRLPSVPDPFGDDDWKTLGYQYTIPNPMPSKFTSLLESPCSIWPGRKIKETHFPFLIPAGIPLGDIKKAVERKLSQTIDISGELWNQLEAHTAPSNVWIMMTMAPIPESIGVPDPLNFISGKNALGQKDRRYNYSSYRVPTPFEMIIAFILNYLRDGYDINFYHQTCSFCHDPSNALISSPLAIGRSGAAHSLFVLNAGPSVNKMGLGLVLK